MGKGLPCRFFLQDGRFQLASGTQKAKDAIWFYCIFDKFRIYTSDFGANFHTLVQRSVAFLFANRNLILGNLRRGITKYVEDVSIKDLDIGYVDNDRTHILLRVEYTSVEENKTTINDVTFV